MFETITVFGGGTMGYGISLEFARHGKKVRLVDVSREALDKSLFNVRRSLTVFQEEGLLGEQSIEDIVANISCFTDATEAAQGADLVIEAVPEKLELKQNLFRDLDGVCRPDTVFVTNTSSLMLSEIFAPVSAARRVRCLTVHYFNPPEIIPLVELLALPETEESVMQAIKALYEGMGKKTLRVFKELPGLCVNRLQTAVRREILWQLDNGVASVEDLNMALFYAPAFRWVTIGFLTSLDMTGLDIVTKSVGNIVKDLDTCADCPAILQKLNSENNLGLKTGKGFFEYPESVRRDLKDRYVRRLVRQLRATLEHVDDIRQEQCQ